MSLSYTQHTLEKLESLLKSLGYKVRYEKGNFKTGACVLENNKVIVVNKFTDLESKINSLVEMVNQLNTGEALLEDQQKQFLRSLKQISLKL
jgi:beta-N-acetylglucosaminidase